MGLGVPLRLVRADTNGLELEPVKSISPAFLSPLWLGKLGPRRWLVGENLVYRSAVLGMQLTIPRGFVTDRASVPRLPMVFFLTGDRADAAATVHDWLYQSHIIGERRLADLVFLEAAVLPPDHESNWMATLMYRGIRIGGRGAWDSGPERLERLENASLPCQCLPIGHTNGA